MCFCTNWIMSPGIFRLEDCVPSHCQLSNLVLSTLCARAGVQAKPASSWPLKIKLQSDGCTLILHVWAYKGDFPPYTIMLYSVSVHILLEAAHVCGNIAVHRIIIMLFLVRTDNWLYVWLHARSDSKDYLNPPGMRDTYHKSVWSWAACTKASTYRWKTSPQLRQTRQLANQWLLYGTWKRT